MHSIGYLKLLMVLVCIILLPVSEASCSKKKCMKNSIKDVEMYDRVFIYAGENMRGGIGAEPITNETILEYQDLGGRKNRTQIIKAGRNALEFFKCRFGLSPYVTDKQLYDATKVDYGNYTFSTEPFPFLPGPYRLILESKGCKSRSYYKNPKPVLIIGNGIRIRRKINAGGTYNKPLYPGDLLVAGVYMINSTMDCSMDGLVLLPFITYLPVKPYGGSGFVTHPKYGIGTFQGSFVKDNTGLTRISNVVRFPVEPKGVKCPLVYL